MSKDSPNISQEFCEQVREGGWYMALLHLDGILKNNKCPDCPNNGTDACKNHVKDLIGDFLPSFKK